MFRWKKNSISQQSNNVPLKFCMEEVLELNAVSYVEVYLLNCTKLPLMLQYSNHVELVSRSTLVYIFKIHKFSSAAATSTE